MKKILRRRVSDSAGFTLIELLIVVAMIGIFTAIGGVNFIRGLPERRLRGAARNLYSDLQKARLLAVKENKSVTVRFVDGAGGADFYYFDYDGNGAYDAAAEPFTDDNGNSLWDVGEAYDDTNGSGNYTKQEFIANLSEYRDVEYGSGAAGDGAGGGACNWNGDPCSQAAFITFTKTGTAIFQILFLGPSSIYLQSQTEQSASYAVTVSFVGSVKIRKFDGTEWWK